MRRGSPAKALLPTPQYPYGTEKKKHNYFNLVAWRDSDDVGHNFVFVHGGRAFGRVQTIVGSTERGVQTWNDGMFNLTRQT